MWGSGSGRERCVRVQALSSRLTHYHPVAKDNDAVGPNGSGVNKWASSMLNGWAQRLGRQSTCYLYVRVYGIYPMSALAEPWYSILQLRHGAAAWLNSRVVSSRRRLFLSYWNLPHFPRKQERSTTTTKPTTRSRSSKDAQGYPVCGSRGMLDGFNWVVPKVSSFSSLTL